MHILVIVIAVALVGFGAFTQLNEEKNSDVQSVLGDTPSPESTQTPTATDTPSETPAPSVTPKQSTQTPTPSQGQLNQQIIDIKTLQYAGARVVYQDSSAVNLESTDDPDAITDWYKSKIESAGYNAKSFVKTKANGNVKNSLVGADGKTEIRVEITKSPESNTTHIFVSLKTT